MKLGALSLGLEFKELRAGPHASLARWRYCQSMGLHQGLGFRV